MMDWWSCGIRTNSRPKCETLAINLPRRLGRLCCRRICGLIHLMNASAIFPPHGVRTIALIGKYNSRDISNSLCLLANDLQRRGMSVLVEKATAENSGSPQISAWDYGDFAAIGERADLAIVLGGDGTMLNAARQLARFGVPLVGVNQGRLGFMTDIARSDMLAALDDLHYEIGRASCRERV